MAQPTPRRCGAIISAAMPRSTRASAFVTRGCSRRCSGSPQALGYRYAYDAEHDQFVHPGAAYVLRADGRVARVLTGIGLSGGDMRLALVEAGEGRIGTLGDQVRLLCSGFDPAHGTYNLMVSRMLAVAGARRRSLALGGGIGAADASGPPPRGLTSAARVGSAARQASSQARADREHRRRQIEQQRQRRDVERRQDQHGGFEIRAAPASRRRARAARACWSARAPTAARRTAG